MIWSEQKDQIKDCYFYVKKLGFSRKNKDAITYPDLLSARRPIPRSESYPVPEPPNYRNVMTTSIKIRDNEETFLMEIEDVDVVGNENLDPEGKNLIY